MFSYRLRHLLVLSLAAPLAALAWAQEPIAQFKHDGTVYAVTFSPDGKLLISGSNDKTIRVWDLASGKELRRLVGHGQPVWSVAVSPDGKLVASGSFEEAACLRLWDLASGQELRRLNGHPSRVTSVSFAPDGKTLASTSHDGTVRLWDVASGKLHWQMAFPGGGYVNFSTSQYGQRVAS
jgi:WD40 repeat protein